MKEKIKRKLNELNKKELEIDELYSKGLIDFNVARIYNIILENECNLLENILEDKKDVN